VQKADGIGTQWNIPLSRSTKGEEARRGIRYRRRDSKAYRRRDVDAGEKTKKKILC